MADHKAVAKALGPCPHSHANWRDAIARHYDIALTVDFKRKIMHGSVTVTIEIVSAEAKELRLDCKNLAIERVTNAANGDLLAHTIPINDPTFGSCLSIPLAGALGAKGSKSNIKIEYSTTEHSGGLQWLTAEQTGTKKHPFMYSQFEAILCRTAVPVQDTPAVKSSYSIAVNVPPPLVAVCSGTADKKNPTFEDDGTLTFRYTQPVPIPAYLIAWVCGSLESRKVGPRSSVWAEKNLIDRAVYEFSADTENYIVAGEKVTGVTYDWGPYDMVVLPAAFPYGGMENPSLTSVTFPDLLRGGCADLSPVMAYCVFLSSSLLAGDRSLTNVVAHEIMHSWAGNYVTNAKWSEFWLNEGFDVYLERLVLGETHKSESYRHFEILGGYNDLIKTVHSHNEHGHAEFTKLMPNLLGVDPDEAFSKIPYEKGSLFLFFLERTINDGEAGKEFTGNGKIGMRQWLTRYYTDFRSKSVTVAEMVAHFLEFFTPRVAASTLAKINWDEWLHTAGLPKYNPNDDKAVDRSLVTGVEALANKWLVGAGAEAKADDLKSFSSKQTMFFLDTLINSKVTPNPFATDAKTHGAAGNPLLTKIDELYRLSESKNVEIGFRFISLCLTNAHRGALPHAAHFLSQHGRGLYTKPLYSKLAALDKAFAVATYQKNKSFYHSIIRHYCKGLGLGTD